MRCDFHGPASVRSWLRTSLEYARRLAIMFFRVAFPPLYSAAALVLLALGARMAPVDASVEPSLSLSWAAFASGAAARELTVPALDCQVSSPGAVRDPHAIYGTAER